MKKIVAISVMFALVAAAAFAQPTVGGQFKAGATLFTGSTAKDVSQDLNFYAGDPAAIAADPNGYKTETEKFDELGRDILAGGRIPGDGTEGYLNLKFGDAEMGGSIRFYARSAGSYHGESAFAFMWWRPSELFRIQIGHNPDADWGAANITGWGFNGEAQDFVALDQDTGDFRAWGTPYGQNDSSFYVARRTGFYGGIKSTHAVLTSLYPIEGLTVNIGLPFGDITDGSNAGKSNNIGRAADKWLRLHAQIKYDLEEVGSIFVTYEGQGQAQNMVKERDLNAKGQWYETDDSKNWGVKDGETDEYLNPVYRVEAPKLWLSFFGNKLVDGLAFDVGFGFQPQTADGNTPPIEIGLGASYNINEEFNIKLRTGAKLAGKSRGKYAIQTWEQDTYDEAKALLVETKTTAADGTVTVNKTAASSLPGTYWKPVEADPQLTGQSPHDKKWSEDWATATEIGVNILPSYKLSAFTFYLNAGLGFTFYPEETGNPNRVYTREERQKYAHSVADAGAAVRKLVDGNPAATAEERQKTYDAALYTPEQSVAISWYVNPYIRKSVNGASLMAGVKLWSSGRDANYWQGKNETSWVKDVPSDTTDRKVTTASWFRTISWAIPIGVNVYF